MAEEKGRFDWMTCDEPTEMREHIEGAISDHKARCFVTACRNVASTVENWEPARAESNFQFWLTALDKQGGSFASMEWFRNATPQVRADILREIFPDPTAWKTKRCPHCDGSVTKKATPSGLMAKCDGVCLRTIDLWTNWTEFPFKHAWRTPTAVGIASQIDESGDFDAMPILADALEEAGCEDERVLKHCRQKKCPRDTDGDGNCDRHPNGCPLVDHLRGCWVIDLILGRE